MKYEMCIYVFVKLKDIYCHLWNICMLLNFIIVFICHIKKKMCLYFVYKKLCVYMSFNIKRHIHTSVISWWLSTVCYHLESQGHKVRGGSTQNDTREIHDQTSWNPPKYVVGLLSSKTESYRWSYWGGFLPLQEWRPKNRSGTEGRIKVPSVAVLLLRPSHLVAGSRLQDSRGYMA